MDVPEQQRSVPAVEPLVALDLGKLWILGIVREADGSMIGPGLHRYSYLADCECPGDCNRDHDNE